MSKSLIRTGAAGTPTLLNNKLFISCDGSLIWPYIFGVEALWDYCTCHKFSSGRVKYLDVIITHIHVMLLVSILLYRQTYDIVDISQSIIS